MIKTGRETHVFDLAGYGGKGKRVTVTLDFLEKEIRARLEAPGGLKRRDRREARRYLKGLFKTLDCDSRPMRLATVSEGRLVSLGFEQSGVCGVVFL